MGDSVAEAGAAHGAGCSLARQGRACAVGESRAGHQGRPPGRPPEARGAPWPSSAQAAVRGPGVRVPVLPDSRREDTRVRTRPRGPRQPERSAQPPRAPCAVMLRPRFAHARRSAPRPARLRGLLVGFRGRASLRPPGPATCRCLSLSLRGTFPPRPRLGAGVPSLPPLRTRRRSA